MVFFLDEVILLFLIGLVLFLRGGVGALFLDTGAGTVEIRVSAIVFDGDGGDVGVRFLDGDDGERFLGGEGDRFRIGDNRMFFRIGDDGERFLGGDGERFRIGDNTMFFRVGDDGELFLGGEGDSFRECFRNGRCGEGDFLPRFVVLTAVVGGCGDFLGWLCFKFRPDVERWCARPRVACLALPFG